MLYNFESYIMKKLLVIFGLFLSMNCAQAVQQTVDVSGLTQAQIAQITADVESKKASPVQTAVAVREEVNAWGEMGANVGKAIIAAAKELGMAANEFASTSLGKFVIGVIIFKLAGSAILHILIGSMVIVISLTLGWKLMKYSESNIEYDYKPVLWGLYNKRVIIKHTAHDIGHHNAWPHIIMAGGFIGGVIIMLTF